MADRRHRCSRCTSLLDEDQLVKFRTPQKIAQARRKPVPVGWFTTSDSMVACDLYLLCYCWTCESVFESVLHYGNDALCVQCPNCRARHQVHDRVIYREVVCSEPKSFPERCVLNWTIQWGTQRATLVMRMVTMALLALAVGSCVGLVRTLLW